ncbi:MAG: hypothetical protein D0531_04625 [Methylococcales bacterium]|nr:MAG: hypothetical protein D0531_04625 [Methylococcales bacterium]
MFNKISPLILVITLINLSGCSSAYRSYKTQAYLNTDLVEASYKASNQLQDKFTRNVPKDTLILVSTLLNVKNLKESSAFGRIISNQIGTSLHDAGYQIIGMDLPADLFMMKDDGELLLSESDKARLKQYQSVIIVGGVYAPGKQNTYVTLRAVDRFTKQVIASTDFSVALGPDVKVLLKTKDTDTLNSAGALTEPSTGNVATTNKDGASSVESISPNASAVLTNPDTNNQGISPVTTNKAYSEEDPFTPKEKQADTIN